MRVTGERKCGLYLSATADVRESAKTNDDNDGALISPVARATTMIAYHHHSRVNRARLPSTAGTSA